MDLVNIFFTEKIFLNASVSRAGPLESVHALHRYLKNFALDLLEKSQQTHSVEIQEDSEGDDTSIADAADLSPNHIQILREAGLDLQTVSQSAAQFIQTLTAGELAYLTHHSCADEGVKEPISAIAKRLELGSTFHLRAKSLGITRSKGETYVGYEKTKIGRWLASVGAQISEGWQTELAVLLIVLCLQVQLAREVPE